MVNAQHPVVRVVVERWKTKSKPGSRHPDDKAKVALAIEGGGMRGCVSAGASAALQYLGLADSVDVVYGSSAGSMIGSYFVTRQAGGMSIYHDTLPAAGSEFIDKKKLLMALVLPSFVSMEKRQANVFNLDFLLEGVMAQSHPLDWAAFEQSQSSQPLKIVASSIRTFQPVVMSYGNGDFADLDGMLKCIRASMGVPGITGPLMARATRGPVTVPVRGRSDTANSSGGGGGGERGVASATQAQAAQTGGDGEMPPAHPFPLAERNESSDAYMHAGVVGKRSRKSGGRRAFTRGQPIPAHWQLDPLADALVAEPIPYVFYSMFFLPFSLSLSLSLSLVHLLLLVCILWRHDV
jgi:hypothetical protein